METNTQITTKITNGMTTYACSFKSTVEANTWLAGQNNIVIKKNNLSFV